MITDHTGSTPADPAEDAPKPAGLALLRAPFPAHQIGKLPKPTKQQTEAVKNNYKEGERCALCGTWHHPNVIHLDYVGHAPLTDRLLDADPNWTWEPPSADELARLPAAGKDGMWIKLTVCGVTRFGFGDAQGKSGGDAIKEMIGDALRNAAMRFGCALELWHKGDLHREEVEPTTNPPATKAKPTATAKQKEAPPDAPPGLTDDEFDHACTQMAEAGSFKDLRTAYTTAYRKATPEQQAVLQVAYEGIKAKRNWNPPMGPNQS